MLQANASLALLKEIDLVMLRRKLRVACNSMSVMKPQALEWYTDEIRWNIPAAAIRLLMTPGIEAKLAVDVRYCLTCLYAIYDAEITRAAVSADFSKETGGLNNLLNAQATLHSLCAHKDDKSLEDDWQRFLNCVSACPNCSDILERQARETLSTHILSALLEFSDTPVPETLLCLLRLYTVLTFLPTRITYDDALFNWVIFGQA